jgi:hypothetical protein
MSGRMSSAIGRRSSVVGQLSVVDHRLSVVVSFAARLLRVRKTYQAPAKMNELNFTGARMGGQGFEITLIVGRLVQSLQI